MPLPSLADIFAPGALGMLLYVLGVLVVPIAFGIGLRRWAALGIVFMIWVGLMLLANVVGWLDGTDDISKWGKVGGSAALILVPAEAMTAGAILLGRSPFVGFRRTPGRLPRGSR